MTDVGPVGGLDNQGEVADRGRKQPPIGRAAAWSIVVGALLLSGLASAFYGHTKVGSHVQIELSCKMIARAMRERIIDASQRRQIMQAALESKKLSAAGRTAAARIQAGCRGVRT